MVEGDAATPDYPREWEADVVLRDGTLAHVRPITPEDTERIHAFHAGQSDESIYLRFFAPIARLSDADVHRFTHVDHRDRVAIVALVRDDIIGIGRFDRTPDTDDAAVAFNVSDAYHGRGVGSVLLEHLAVIAQELGVQRFTADVMPQNRTMMNVFLAAGYELGHSFTEGVIAVEFAIEPTARSRAVQLAREHRAEAQSMTGVLTPRSVAVVGASRRPDAVGSLVLDNILDGGFTGQVHVVNSEAASVRGLPAHPRITDIPGGVDLVVIAVPAEAVLDVVDDAGASGARAVVVLSSGFAESGRVGEALQDELLRRARGHGMRVIGPASLGLVNTAPEVRLAATMARHVPAPGELGVFSQSGGIGVGLLAEVAERGLGVSVFVSAGNRVDVSGNDVMQFFLDDDATAGVGLYLESVGNARKFSRIARTLALRKPVIAVKTGTTGTVPPGHRARATTAPPEAFDVLLDRAGVIRAQNAEELLDIAELIVHQPLPAGPRLAVVGTSHGLSAVAADHAARSGLQVTRGPVTLPIACTAEQIAQAVDDALADPGVDAVLVCITPPVSTSDEQVARAIAHVAWNHDKPCITAFPGMRDLRSVLRRAARPRPDGTGREELPVYDTPERGVAALAAVTRYAKWLASDHGEDTPLAGVDRAAARRLVDRVLAGHTQGRTLTLDESITLLATYGIEVRPAFPVHTPEEAVDAARRLDGPVVVRSLAEAAHGRPDAAHTGLTHPDAVADAVTDLTGRFARRAAAERDDDDTEATDDEGAHLVVQAAPPVGIDTLIRSVEDPLFGPVVSFGLAGPASTLLGDLAHGIPPLTDVEAAALVTGMAAAPLLTGTAGRPGVDRAALAELLRRVAHLADDVPEIAQLTLEPVTAHPGGVVVLGASVRLAPANLRTDPGRRALA